MDRFEKKFSEHNIRLTIETILGFLDLENNQEIDEIVFSEIKRIKVIMLKLQKFLSLDVSHEVSFSALDDLNVLLKNNSFMNQLKNYKQNSKLQHLVNANNHLSSLLPMVDKLISCVRNDIFNESENSFSQESLDYLFDRNKEITIKFKKKDSELSQLKEKINQLKVFVIEEEKNIKNEISGWNTKFTDLNLELKNKFLDLYNEKEDEFRVLQNGSIVAFNNKNNELSIKYKEFFKAYESDVLKKSDEVINDAKSRFDSYRERMEYKVNEFKNDIEEKNHKVIELYDLISGGIIGGEYKKTAEGEDKQANFWRYVSLGFIVASVICLLASFVTFQNDSTPEIKGNSANDASISSSHTLPDETKNKPSVLEKDKSKSVASDNKIITESTLEKGSPSYSRFGEVDSLSFWQRILMSLSITVALFFGASYASRQSHSHRIEAKKARWFFLQVTSLDPYISSLDEQSKNDIKIKLSEKIFNGVGEYTNDEKPYESEKLSVLIDGIAKVIKETKK